VPRNNRDRRDANRRVVHVTNRCWKGLPFSPNRFMRRSLEAVLAKAQNKYQIVIICYLFMGNHYHLILAGGGKRLSPFMNYIDGEIAKRMIRLYGNHWGGHFWQDRYHEQKLCSVDDVLNKTAYIFANPVKAGLVHKASEYPGASSIRALYRSDNKTSSLLPFTYPRRFKKLKSLRTSRKEELRLCKEHIERADEYLSLSTDLFAWESCFKEQRTRGECLDTIRGLIAEAQDEASRKAALGRERLLNQAVNLSYTPKKRHHSKTPFLEAADSELRKVEIASFRYFQTLCRDAWQKFSKGLHVIWPTGAYRPSHYWMAQVVGATG
jgi:putative transposase